jgi:tetratricopeptide (TPR) repeat protein
MGRYEEAIYEAKRACEIDPLSLQMSQLAGHVLALARDYEGAIDALLRILEMDPHFAPAHSALVLVYTAKGMFEEALARFERISSLAGGNPIVDANIKAVKALVLASAGHKTEALKIIEEVTKPPAATSYNIARIYAALGENDHAFECLDSAYSEKSPEIVSLKVDPSFDNLRSDPRFQDLLGRVGLAEPHSI